MCLKLSQFIFFDFIIVVREFCEEYIHGILITGFPVSFCYFFLIKSKYIYKKIRLFKFRLKIQKVPVSCICVLEFLVCEINNFAMDTDGRNTEEHQIIRNIHMHNMPTMHAVIPEDGAVLPKHVGAFFFKLMVPCIMNQC